MKKTADEKPQSNGQAPRAALDWASMPERRRGPRGGASPELQEEIKRLLLGRYTPAAVLVDDSMDVVHVHGQVGRFLKLRTGSAASNLMMMAREELASSLRGVILKAKSEDRPVSKALRYEDEGRTRELILDVQIVRSPTDRRRRYLVLFLEERDAPGGAADDASNGQLVLSSGTPLAPPAQVASRVDSEELRAAKEELQAINVELVVVNEELRRGNSVLNAANDDLSNLLASSQIPILMLDRRMRIRRFTPPAEEAFGVCATDMGQSLGSLKLAIEAPLLKEAVRDVIAGFEPKQLEVRDRHDRWYSLWIRPYKNGVSAIDGAVLSMTEITEKRNGIRALEAARDYAEAIVDTVNDSLLILNRHLKVKSASRSYYEQFQESSAGVVGRSIYELGGGRWNLPPLRKRLAALSVSETAFADWEGEFEVPKAGLRTLAVSGRVVPHDSEGEAKIVISIGDVSLRKQAAEAAALRKSEARQREFVANVSHELLTPITAIKGYSESLIQGALEVPNRRVKFTQIIEKNAERLTQLVEDLLQLSSYDEVRARGRVESVPLRAIIEKAARGLAAAARSRGVSVRVLAPDALRVTMGRSELTQISVNLIQNAIKYNKPKGRIVVRARKVGRRVLVSVQDTGIGIPKDDLPRIFDRFHRAENARLKTARGNGLGLAIVRSILVGRGCRIWAESAAGKGTTVYFTLPAVEPSRRRRRRAS